MDGTDSVGLSPEDHRRLVDDVEKRRHDSDFARQMKELLDQPKSGFAAFKKWALIAAGAFLLGWISWTTGTLLAIKEDLAAINASRFTAEQGAEIWRHFAEHEQELWHPGMGHRFADHVEGINRRLGRIEAKVDALK